MNNGKRGLRITFNAPAILGFAAICLIVQVINVLTGGESNLTLFSVYRTGLTDPMQYVRCITHVFGHSDWTHLMNNMLYLLILGPMLEEKYGSRRMILVMLAAALATGIVNAVFFPQVMLLGASGVVFAMILLSSITATQQGEIPLTFLLVAVLYIGQQVYQGIFAADNISQLSHIVGGIVGTVLGFVLNGKRGTHV